ncbi:WG repeat-containing protein [Gelidibacter japonicus]|uniref:WG repeat-containing protein n=1 Tax=Gelidibacter japonicus TaxID=1962232 RepID=UPI0013CF69B6|nr:WG repeat-containing protein [Gelidibacter japonicus]
MKKLLITLVLIPFLGIAQTIENIDYISPFNNDVAAIKKGNEWGFIDRDGQLTVDFRNDLVLTKTENAAYPIFSNGKCLIAHQKNGVLYYGYIDKSGKTVITPQFLNANNFQYGKALALKVEKETIGYNDIFKKDVVSYHYFELVIDEEGKTTDHLTKLAIHVSPKNKDNKNPPAITSKLISENLVAIKGSNKKWRVKKIE